jgi:rhodanese-related sulfurtransferase
LKKRLDWGEPALTIIDVRDREAFNTSHITGAVSLPLSQLVTVRSLIFEE